MAVERDDRQERERSKAVELAVGQIEKQFGKGSIMRLGANDLYPNPTPETVRLFYVYTLGAFANLRFAFPLSGLPGTVAAYLALLVDNFTTAGIGLGFFGLWVLLARDVRCFWLLVSMYCVQIAVFTQMLLMDPHVFYIPTNLLFALFIACGPSAQQPITPQKPVATVTPPQTHDVPLTLDKRVRTGKLPSGLTYYVLQHKKPEKRAQIMEAFRKGEYDVVLANRVASEGLDFEFCSTVINYDLPKMAEDFIHRVGRTGRAGSLGRASSLVAGVEVLELRQIERTLKLRIERQQLDPATSDRPKRVVQNTLQSRTLSALPGEVFV